MIITLFLQVKDELVTGHLERFFEWNSEIFDHIAVIDDSSTDGSNEFLKTRVDLLIENDFCSFRSELSNKKNLLDYAKRKFPDTNWFLWLDADEILFATREELERLISFAEIHGFDGVQLPLTNLWKSELFFRTDSAFDSLTNVRLWKNSKHLEFVAETGLHKSLHPKGIVKVLPWNELHVTHFGFASPELIARKFKTYRGVGQQGKNLWRLVNESNMVLRPIQDRFEIMGSRSREYFSTFPSNHEAVNSSSLYEYLLASKNLAIPRKERPFISLICLIYSGIDWLEFQYGELLKLQRELGPDEVEILFVANDASVPVLNFLKHNNIPHVVAPGRKNSEEWYINSVYRAYNFGALSARGRYLLFVNSDMAYAPGFLHAMASAAGPKIYLVSKLVESGRLKPAEIAIKRNFGKSLKTFRRKSFYRFAQRNLSDSTENGGLFMPCLVSRDEFLDLGGYPEGNILKESYTSYLKSGEYRLARPGEDLITGDKSFVDRFIAKNGEQLTTNNAMVYHFQEGEKSTSHRSKNKSVPSGIAISNDQLIGINGELTLWNYLIQDLTERGFGLKAISLGVNQALPYRLSRHGLWTKPTPRVLFRNATFLRAIRGPWRQIVLLQDKVQSEKLLRKQRCAIKTSAALVTNSPAMLLENCDNTFQHFYLQPLPVHPEWELVGMPIQKRNKLTAIFVGAFNETKGWEQVRQVIESNLSIHFICVSKYPLDNPNFSGGKIPDNVDILRCLSTSELVSAVDSAHIFIVGSAFETQCLAALEAATRNLIVCMRNTGLLSQLPKSLRDQIGIFRPDLRLGFEELLDRMTRSPNSFQPALAIREAGLEVTPIRSEWLEIFELELQESFIPSIRKSPYEYLKGKLPTELKETIKKFIHL